MHEGQAKTPSGSSIQKGRNYKEVEEDFKEHGFKNISFVVMNDLITGWITKDGSVESVSVDGDEGYSSDEWYPNNVSVVITYHTFPEKKEQDDILEESTEQSTSPKDNEKSEETSKVDEEIFTVENCSDLSNLLSIKADIDPFYLEFAEKYKGKTIMFDGYIYYSDNHGDYNTRYDILLQGGNYIDEETMLPGPIFKFENVSTIDLGVNDLFLPSFAKTIGTSVRITAIVEKYNDDTGIFFLKPVLLEER